MENDTQNLLNDCFSELRKHANRQTHDLRALESLLTASIYQNEQLVVNADKRLEMANKMVLRLTEAIDGAMCMCKDLEEKYTHHIDALCKQRDDLLIKNAELSNRLDKQYEKILIALEGLISRPTVENNNY